MTQNKTYLSDAAKKARAEYLRAYRKRNPEKVKKWNMNYWERVAKKAKETAMKENDDEV